MCIKYTAHVHLPSLVLMDWHLSGSAFLCDFYWSEMSEQALAGWDSPRLLGFGTVVEDVQHCNIWFCGNFQIPVPAEVISSLSVPTTDSIHFHPLVAVGNHQSEEAVAGLPEYSRLPVHKIPFFFQLYHIHSSFVEVNCMVHVQAIVEKTVYYNKTLGNYLKATVICGY